MNLETHIRNKLLMRGFSNEILINNRGLIGAVTEEVVLKITKSFVEKPDADDLIKSLGKPDLNNTYKLRTDKEGKWLIEHEIVGSGEPLKQWLLDKPIGQ